MVRLHGFRETAQLNLYDAFALNQLSQSSGLGSPEARIFTGKNIGRAELTNLEEPATVPNGGTAVIANWYARCPLDHSAPLSEWTHATMLCLNVGYRPIANLPLSDLLQREEGDRIVNLDDGYAGRVTEAMYKGYAERCDAPTWEEMSKGSPDRRAAWYEAFRIARAEMQPARTVAMIPIRQCFHVTITTSAAALKRLIDHIGPQVADRPIVWVHLEGHSIRDIC